MTAEELIAAGYRLHVVTIEVEVPVFCKQDELSRLSADQVVRWALAADDSFDIVGIRPMTEKQANKYRDCAPSGYASFMPTVGELMDVGYIAK